MDAQLKAQLRQIISVATQTSVSAAGDPSFAAPTAVAARVEDDVSTTSSKDGGERVSRKRIVTEAAIRISDRIWLPGDSTADASLARSPMSVQELPDELGSTDHFETVV